MATNQEPLERQIQPQNNNVTMATNNPQANVSQAQPINQNTQVQVGQMQQLQPYNNNNMQGLSTISNNQSTQNVQNYNVPTAVEYQAPQQTQNANIQSAFNNYQSQYNYESNLPQIKMPTASPNTIEGQYQSRWADALSQIVEQLSNQRFSYNPNEDDLLKQSAQFASQNVYESMNSRGILNSSLTAERVTRVVGELIPTYEKMARDEFDASMNRLINVANLMMDMDNREFAQWQDAQDRKWQEEERTYQRKLDALDQAWKRVDELGYVDNESAIVLGVAAGTLSKDAREAKEAYERQIEEWNRQHEIEKQTQIELYKLQQDLKKDMYDYESSRELENYEKQLQVQKKYNTVSTTGSSSVNNNYRSLSTYEDIIKNNYLEEDPGTGRWVASDNDALYKYLYNEYNSGLMSPSDLYTLLQKYNVKNPNSNNSNSKTSFSQAQNDPAKLTSANIQTWIDALDGNNKALDKLGVTINGQKQGWFNNKSVKNAVNKALEKINNGEYQYKDAQTLMNDLLRSDENLFGKLSWGF